jgi:hypothetical protein
LLVWRIGLLQHLTLGGGQVAVTLSLALLGACVYIGLIYPLYLIVPFSKVNILSNVPFYVVAVGLVYAAKRTHWLDGLGTVADFYRRHAGWGSGLTLAAGVGILAVSWALAQGIRTVTRRP